QDRTVDRGIGRAGQRRRSPGPLDAGPRSRLPTAHGHWGRDRGAERADLSVEPHLGAPFSIIPTETPMIQTRIVLTLLVSLAATWLPFAITRADEGNDKLSAILVPGDDWQPVVSGLG